MTAETYVYLIFFLTFVGGLAIGGWFVRTEPGKRFIDWLGRWF